MRIHSLSNGWRIDTPAKINLFLEVLGKRPDGYHELETVMLSVGLYDTLEFRLSSEPGIRCELGSRGPGIPCDLPLDGRNLIVKAGELLRQHVRCPLGAVITLHKRIPLEAGLGGGSSDAAAALVGLNRLWNLRLPVDELHSLAARLGSDVNFFLESPLAAACRGRGERIQPLPAPSGLPIVLVKPPAGCSTGAVFQRLKLPETPRPGASLINSLAAGRFTEMAQTLHNALEAPAIELNPDVARILTELRRADVLAAQMSGSGSACFALCRSWQHAQQVGARCREQRLGLVAVVNAQP